MIVVTGASGVIGRALIARLHAEHLPYVSLTRALLAHAPVADHIRALPQRPSSIVHLAAAVPRPPTLVDNEQNAIHTRTVDLQVLEAARELGCHTVYASGCSLYPKAGTAPKHEEEAQAVNPQASSYLAAKQQGEHDFLTTGNSTVLRISAPIGEGVPSTTIVGRFLEAARRGDEIEIWGSGTREQNYVDVIDLADAIYRSLLIRPSTLINIAADQPLTMHDLAQEVVRVLGHGTVRMTGHPDPKDGEPARYANQRAKEMLGWHPVISIDASLERLSKIQQ